MTKSSKFPFKISRDSIMTKALEKKSFFIDLYTLILDCEYENSKDGKCEYITEVYLSESDFQRLEGEFDSFDIERDDEVKSVSTRKAVFSIELGKVVICEESKISEFLLQQILFARELRKEREENPNSKKVYIRRRAQIRNRKK